jgi:hypothetical protein
VKRDSGHWGNPEFALSQRAADRRSLSMCHSEERSDEEISSPMVDPSLSLRVTFFLGRKSRAARLRWFSFLKSHITFYNILG